LIQKRKSQLRSQNLKNKKRKLRRNKGKNQKEKKKALVLAK